jgi:hypothetical protein
MKGAKRLRAGLYELDVVCPGDGARIRVERIPLEHARPEFRWEAHCPECQDSDPNGYRTMRETVEAAPEFWGGDGL